VIGALLFFLTLTVAQARVTADCSRQAEMPAAVGAQVSQSYDLLTCWLMNSGSDPVDVTLDQLSLALVAQGVMVADPGAALLNFREVTRKGARATIVRVVKRVGFAVSEYAAPVGAALLGSGPWVAAAWVIGDRLVRDSLQAAEARIPQEATVSALSSPSSFTLKPGQIGVMRVLVVGGASKPTAHASIHTWSDSMEIEGE